MPAQKVGITEFLTLGKHYPVLDVRSPSEYAYAHIPGAHSFPIFDDAQRKEIGTTYKQVSREDAIKIGLKYFGPNMLAFVEKAETILKQYKVPDKKLLVHCWRGGMRSGAMAWLLNFYGFEVYLLEGGYKNYRHWVLQQLDLPFRFIALGGFTGSGKTEVLHELSKQGKQIIDLERIASHKGSAFGSMGMNEQPSQEYFENILVAALQPFYHLNDDDPFFQEHPIWIENESRRIGLINLTEQFYNRLQEAPLFALDIPFEERLNFIVEGYGKFDKEKLVNAIIRIQKRLGGLDTKNAINFLLENDIYSCFRILLSYYDKQYTQAMEKSNRAIQLMPAPKVDALINTELVLKTTQHHAQ
ncbi:MAG: tRNA 2-selenouridine(34) synthase MnmH [Bacteroidota bacterium]